MENGFISSPKDFRYMEGSEMTNHRKTFNLSGIENDEMLRLYLRKAGLSDEIECLTVEQRRAFIYDIIKSNKTPGYWLPSTMQNSSFNPQRPNIQQPSTPTYSIAPSPFTERKNASGSPMINYTTMRLSASTDSLQSLSKNSPTLPQRFIPAPATPPSPSTFVTSSKGVQYEISGPMNFQHTAGDMTRDMTRNAFDLTPSSNDNVLRKYMMERGISDEDISGMRKTDLIRKIVQSKFTWLPKKKKNSDKNKAAAIDQRINYATISGYPDNTKSRTPLRPAPIPKPPSPPTTPPESKPDFSNFTLVTSRFTDPSRFPGVDEYRTPSNNGVIDLPPLPPGTQLPAPPPRKSQYSSGSLPTIKRNAPPPPPLVIAAQANAPNVIYQTRDQGDYDNNYGFNAHQSRPNAYEPAYATVQENSKNKSNRSPPPITPKPYITGNVPFPPPVATIPRVPPQQQSVTKTGGIPPPPPPMAAKANIPPPPPMAAMGNIPPPPPMAAMGNIPPPPPMAAMGNIPPPPPMAAMGNIPPPPPMAAKSNGGIPPPPPPITGAPSAAATAKKPIPNSGGDPRDALLESIRNGITLKKVDQKAATISGVKPRAERRPQVPDFLTELKMGVTSRRMKNPQDNPFKGDENNEWND